MIPLFESGSQKGIGPMPSQQEYHRELAISLIKSVGFDGAIDYARENQWEGVLAQLLRLPTAVLPEKPEPLPT